MLLMKYRKITRGVISKGDMLTFWHGVKEPASYKQIGMDVGEWLRSGHRSKVMRPIQPKKKPKAGKVKSVHAWAIPCGSRILGNQIFATRREARKVTEEQYGTKVIRVLITPLK